MANYVWNKVICNEQTLNKYFIDYTPIDDEVMDKTYITFNKIIGVKSLHEYSEKVGTTIYYGYGFSYRSMGNSICEIMFCTRWKYPIQAIKKLLEISNETVWYLVEENYRYISKFYWDNGVKEKIMPLKEDFDEWLEENQDVYINLEDYDTDVWYYLQETSKNWMNWENDDDFKRYEEDVSSLDLPF